MEEAGVKVREFVYYDSPRTVPQYAGDTLPHVVWPEIQLPEGLDPQWAVKKYVTDKPFVAIQPFGSPYANVNQANAGRPQKMIPNGILTAAVQRLHEKYRCVIVCSRDEAALLQIDAPHVILDGTMWENLGALMACKAFIGVDSCGKTMAAINKIPTYTLIGDYPDGGRDKIFLRPYVDAGVMKTQRFWKMRPRHLNFALEPLLDESSPHIG